MDAIRELIDWAEYNSYLQKTKLIIHNAIRQLDETEALLREALVVVEELTQYFNSGEDFIWPNYFWDKIEKAQALAPKIKAALGEEEVK